jgi:hypothetical protein
MLRVSKRVLTATFVLIVLTIAACAPALTPVPWTFNSEWWKRTHVWYFGPPLAYAESKYYYDVLDKTGVTVVNWLDIRWHEDWEAKLRRIVDELHRRGISVVGDISMITIWQEQREKPPELLEAVLRDPYGNIIKDNFGTPSTYPVHSTLHPAWQEYLLLAIRKTIDTGVDGMIIDELAYGSLSYPDFNKYTVEEFREYLLETYSAEELEKIRQKYSIENFENFDYAELVKRYLPTGMTQLTQEEWDRRWEIPIPLYRNFDRFRTVKNKESMARLISKAKAYAKEQYGKDIPFSANLNDLTAPPALYVIDLLDYVEMEWFYYQNGYFPKARAFSSLKLAESFGKRGNLLTSMGTRSDIVERGKDRSVNLYKMMIAEGYGAGGAFHVEEGSHEIQLDIEAVAPYFHFVREKPFLFENLKPVKGDIGVLYLWEAIDAFQARAYRGLSNMLADSSYQLSVVFGAEDILPADPAPPYPLQLDSLLQYTVIMVPELLDITEKHTDLLLQYVENGGRLIIFATDDMLQQIEWNRGESQSVRLLLDYLRAGETTVGIGKILRVGQIWGKEYLESLDQGLRLQLQQMLSQEGIQPKVKMISDARVLSTFAYIGKNQLVIHFVNYDYDLENDSTNPIQALELDLSLGELPREGITATFYSPNAPEGQRLEATAQQSTLSLTIPEIDIWGVLLVRA